MNTKNIILIDKFKGGSIICDKEDIISYISSKEFDVLTLYDPSVDYTKMKIYKIKKNPFMINYLLENFIKCNYTSKSGKDTDIYINLEMIQDIETIIKTFNENITTPITIVHMKNGTIYEIKDTISDLYSKLKEE